MQGKKVMIMFQEENAGFINLDKYKSKSVGDRWWEMREEKNVETIWRYCYLYPTQRRVKILEQILYHKKFKYEHITIIKFPITIMSYGTNYLETDERRQ